METLIIVILVVFVMVAIRSLGNSTSVIEKAQRTYKYEVKGKIMTERELIFYEKLINVGGEKYAVIPQVHLSAFLNHKLKGQNWKGAFSVINGKSVDFLFVDKSTQKPAIAVELDDYSHQSNARIERDRKVEDIMQASGMRLVRFSNVNVSEEQIFERLAHPKSAV